MASAVEESVLQQAQAAIKEKKYDRALELYNQAVEANPTAEVLAGRAQVHNKLKNFMEAAADASHAIELDDKLAAAHKEKGHACYGLEEFESAEEAFEAAAALEPTKTIHKTWANMCKVQLGEELPPVPMRFDEHSKQQESAAGPESGTAGDTGASGSGSGSGKGISLQGDQLKAFLAQAQRGNLDALLGGKRPPQEEEEEPGTAQPKNATADDPEFSKYWKAPIAASVAASLPDRPQGLKYRHQWFQSAERVEVDVLAKGLKKEQVEVTIEPRRLRVATTSTEGQPDFELDLALHGQVVPAESRFEVLGSKVEIKLKKAAAQQWPQLEAANGEALAQQAQQAGQADQTGTGEGVTAEVAAAVPQTQQPTPAYPYAGKKVDWDKFAKQVQQEEKEEKPEGDAALMKFFRELYEGGDEDTRRAMVKSMQESGGTALSMNWGEVGKKDYSKQDKDEDEEWPRR